jgi:hypothetical protein
LRFFADQTIIKPEPRAVYFLAGCKSSTPVEST